MSLTCAISGVTPTEPVISKQGYIFEKSLIVKHLKISPTCPITKADLAIEELIPIRTSPGIRPRPPTATSIPGLLQLFQNEWDAVMLETHSLKSHLETCRQELAHSLYKHDAACRVIARLIKERDQARAALTSTQQNVSTAVRQASTGGASGGEGLSSDVIAKLDATNASLSQTRKARNKANAAKVTSGDKIVRFAPKASQPVSAPGTAIDINPADPNFVVAGSSDGSAVVFNHSSNKIVDTLRGHSNAITSVRYHPSEHAIFTSSLDGTASIWTRRGDNKYHVANTIREHKGAVNDICVHPSGDLLLTASSDRTWTLYDCVAGITKYHAPEEKDVSLTRISLHPDGLLMGIGGSDSVVRIWDLKQLKPVALFKGHNATITNVTFSENGYQFASSDDAGVIKFWDLRKSINYHTISSPDVTSVRSLDYDISGTYIIAGGNDVRVYATKALDQVVARFSDDVGAIRFGVDASWYASVGRDRAVKVVGL